jgi:hypothetical protein
MAKRLSVILADVDEVRIEPFMESSTPQHAVLQGWVARHGGGNVNSEAAAIRALMWAGAVALQDEVLDIGYAELATFYADDEARAERRAARDRYVARTEAAR